MLRSGSQLSADVATSQVRTNFSCRLPTAPPKALTEFRGYTLQLNVWFTLAPAQALGSDKSGLSAPGHSQAPRLAVALQGLPLIPEVGELTSNTTNCSSPLASRLIRRLAISRP